MEQMREALDAYREARIFDAEALEPNNCGNIAGDALADAVDAVLEATTPDEVWEWKNQ